MSRPNFSNIALNLSREKAEKSGNTWLSPEQIEIQKNYKAKDIEHT